MQRYHITVGATTTAGGTVTSGCSRSTINDQPMAREGDEVQCPACASTGQIVCDGLHLSETIDGREAALDGDLCRCLCSPAPRLIANQTLRSQTIADSAVSSTASAATTPPPAAPPPRPANPVRAASSGAANFSSPQGTSCENLWRQYQLQAEAIVAPGGTLIADAKARNRAINAAYAQLWLDDPRFQWAGLAAFASKQVGCGLLHAAESIDKVQAEHDTRQHLQQRARRGFFGLFSSRSERERQEKVDAFKQSRHEHQVARDNNPVPTIDLRRAGEPLSLVQQQLQHVYDMLAMGNTTLFLDVYPLHLLYRERGLGALEGCLPVRAELYERHPVLWLVGRETLEFGIVHEEVLDTFRAVESGKIANSVESLAKHEQVNILQPVMYSNSQFVRLLRSNHLSFVIGFPSGAAQAIELTLASQCQRIDDGRTISFGSNPFADLSDIKQRMPFVLNAATRFDHLLNSSSRNHIEKSLRTIASVGVEP